MRLHESRGGPQRSARHVGGNLRHAYRSGTGTGLDDDEFVVEQYMQVGHDGRNTCVNICDNSTRHLPTRLSFCAVCSLCMMIEGRAERSVGVSAHWLSVPP